MYHLYLYGSTIITKFLFCICKGMLAKKFARPLLFLFLSSLYRDSGIAHAAKHSSFFFEDIFVFVFNGKQRLMMVKKRLMWWFALKMRLCRLMFCVYLKEGEEEEWVNICLGMFAWYFRFVWLFSPMFLRDINLTTKKKEKIV